MRRTDLIGHNFGRWSVIRASENPGYYLCKCQCGSYKEVFSHNLIRNKTKSCGCLRSELLTKNAPHGLSKKRPYRIWRKMIDRCENPKELNYPRYGGRGIKVCKKWHTFMGFWDEMSRGYRDDLTIDRKDNSKGYNKSNCRWATVLEQNNNTRANRFITFNGKKQTLSQWAVEVAIQEGTIRYRIDKAHWPISRALTTPVR